MGRNYEDAVKSFHKEGRVLCESQQRRGKLSCSKGWSKAGMYYVSVVVEHLHGWSGEGGESKGYETGSKNVK